jgi:hypothetical protein
METPYVSWRKDVEQPDEDVPKLHLSVALSRNLALQESHEVLTATKIWKEKILERSASIRFDTPELPASHM